MYKDVNGQKFCYDLSNYKKIETLGLEYDLNIEWMEEGLKLCEKRAVI